MDTHALRAAALVALAAAGCSPPATHAPLSGRVTVGGRPVTDGLVMFATADGARSVSARLGGGGEYAVADAPVGELMVTVRTKDRATLFGPPVAEGGAVAEGGKLRPSRRPNPRYVATPARYEAFATSDLRVRVAAGGSQQDFDLDPK